MPICENKNCNKEHDGSFGSGKFCSRKCANSRTVSSTTKQKISNGVINHFIDIKKQHQCKSCKSIIETKNKYCDECIKYCLNKTLFKKLNITETNLKLANELAVTLLKKIYFEDKLSSLDIFRKYNIRDNTLFFFFKKNNIPFRTVKESIINAYGTGNLTVNTTLNTSYQNGWYTTWFNSNVYLRSSYERKIAAHFDKLKIYYEVESKRILYIYNNEEHYYIPDFFIPDLNMIIETKSDYLYFKDKDKNDAKLNGARQNGYLVVLLLDNQIDTFISNWKES